MPTADPPTILHVSSEQGWRGGERQVQLLTDGLLARGWPCFVACPVDGALFRDRAKKAIALPLPRSCAEFDPRPVASLIRWARRVGARLLHAHTSHAHTWAWLAGAFLGIPVVVTRRVDFPVGGNLLSRRKYCSPSVRFIAISSRVREVLLEVGVEAQRIRLVHSGIELDRFRFRAGSRDDDIAARRFGVPPSRAILLNVAALTDHKDHVTLLRAAAYLRHRACRPWKLLIAGQGELEAHLRDMIRTLDLVDCVELLGFVDDVAPLYSAADVFVLSSHLEGLGTSILDAMAAGVPVVATAAGGIPEIVQHERTGLLVPPRSPEQLALAIDSLLADPERARALAFAARQRVEAEFSADAMVEGTLAVYREVV